MLGKKFFQEKLKELLSGKYLLTEGIKTIRTINTLL